MDELLDNILFTEKEREKLQIPLVKLEDGLDGLFDETNGYIVYLDQFEKAIEILFGPFINSDSLRIHLNIDDPKAIDFISKLTGFEVILNRKLGQNIIHRM